MRRTSFFCGVVLAVLSLAGAVRPAIAQQQGYYVLDGFGGVHAGGGAPALFPQTPYFGFDAAKAIAYVPAGSSGNDGVLVLDAFGGVYSGGAIGSGNVNPPTPYFGFNIARDIAVRGTGMSGWERRESSCVTVNANSATGFSVSCPFGKKVLGGGILRYFTNACTTSVGASTAPVLMQWSGPVSDTQWKVGVLNQIGSPVYVRAFATCAYGS